MAQETGEQRDGAGPDQLGVEERRVLGEGEELLERGVEIGFGFDESDAISGDGDRAEGGLL